MNKKGPLWIKRELVQKGVSKSDIHDALSQFDSSEEFEQALTVASKRWELDRGEPAAKVRKIMNLLLRRGYTAEVSRKVISTLNNNEQLYFDE